jgi:hypothetical protein
MRCVPMLLLLLLPFAAVPSLAQSLLPLQACSATPEAATQLAIGTDAADAVPGAGIGFRAQGVQVDPVLHRVWMLVRRCEDAAAPALLVPVQQSKQILVAGLRLHTALSSTSSSSLLSEARPVTGAVVHPGDTVHVVFDSSNVHLTLEATADQQGSAGDTIQFTLKRRTASRRMSQSTECMASCVQTRVSRCSRDSNCTDVGRRRARSASCKRFAPITRTVYGQWHPAVALRTWCVGAGEGGYRGLSDAVLKGSCCRFS